MTTTVATSLVCANPACQRGAGGVPRGFRPRRDGQRFCSGHCRQAAWFSSHPRVNLNELPLFRSTDPPTSRAAAQVIRTTLTERQAVVLALIVEAGPLSGREIERRSECERWAPSTARKRCSELLASGFVATDGEETRSGPIPCMCFVATPKGHAASARKQVA